MYCVDKFKGKVSVSEEVITMLIEEKFGIHEESAIKEFGSDPY